MCRFRPQDDIAGAAIHDSIQVIAKPGIYLRPVSIFYIDQNVKINICRIGGTFQDGALLYHNIPGPQHDAVSGIDLAFNFNCFPFGENKPCIVILTVRIPSSEILEVCKVILYVDVFFPHRVPINRIRYENANPSCVDDARWTDCHAVRAYEIQVAVNFTVFNSIHRTLNINFAVNQIHQIIGVISLVLFIEVHVGYIAVADFIFTKPVQTDVVIVQHRLYIQVLNVSSSYQVIPVFVRNRRRKTAHRLQQNTGQHQRRDPPGCQLADNTLCIIFAVVLRNLSHNHVALSHFAPDDFVNFIHKRLPP